MPIYLQVKVAGEADRQTPLTAGGNIGSDPDSMLHIDHASIAAQSVEVSVLNSAVFVRNLNSFDLYVGQRKIAPNAKQRWAEGDVLALSDFVSITLRANAADQPTSAGEVARGSDEFLGEVTPEETRRIRSRNIQIAVIVICVCGGALLLLWDQGKAPPPSKDNFQTLVQDLREKNTPETRRILRHLQDAWRHEKQSTSTRRNDAIQAYEELLQCPEVKRAPYRNSEKIESRVKVFARGRIAFLKE